MFIVFKPITGEIFTPQKPQATYGFLSVMEQIYIFVLFKEKSCLIRNLKHQHIFFVQQGVGFMWANDYHRFR